MISPYDSFAWFYDRYWAPPHERWQKPALDQLFLSCLPPDACILDLCCGTGNLAGYLVSRGFKVIGVDASAEMLRVARQNVPTATFLQSDAAKFLLERPVDGAVCAFDSLNHLLQREQLEKAFGNVYAALKPGGRFVFDVNTTEAYGAAWNDSACEVHSGDAFFLRGGYDPEARIGHTQITMFLPSGSLWARSDVEIRQRPWDAAEVEPLLRSSGFGDIAGCRAFEDLGMAGHYGTGRVYFRACRNSGGPAESSS